MYFPGVLTCTHARLGTDWGQAVEEADGPVKLPVDAGACLCVCVHLSLSACVCVCVCVCVCMCLSTCVCLHVYVCLYMYLRLRMFVSECTVSIYRVEPVAQCFPYVRPVTARSSTRATTLSIGQRD